MIQLKVESALPFHLNFWAMSDPEPLEATMDSNYGGIGSTLAIVPLGRDTNFGDGEFQVLTSDWMTLEGSVVGYFRPFSGKVRSVTLPADLLETLFIIIGFTFFGHCCCIQYGIGISEAKRN
jgi:hypothetical protein